MIIRSRAFLLFAALCSVICAAQATSLQAEEKASVTCKTVSPSDGSLWIATDGDGLTVFVSVAATTTNPVLGDFTYETIA